VNEAVFRLLYEERVKYPLGSKDINRNDEDYIASELTRQNGEDLKFLVLPAHYFERVMSRSIKDDIEKDSHLVGVFDIGQLFSPLTGIKFYIYAFSSFSPRLVWFGEFIGSNRPFKRRPSSIAIDTRFPEYGEVEQHFLTYLDSINLALSDEKKSDYVSKTYRMFGVDPLAVRDRTSVDFYRPEYLEVEAKYAHEETVRLGDIAELIPPKGGNTNNHPLYTIKLSEATYPLKSDALIQVRDGAQITKIKPGDIVTNRFLNSAFLNLTNRQDLVIANTQMIIRLHDKRFNHAYLTAYLNSDRMRVFFERRKRGVTIPMITRKDLLDFEIVVPSKNTNQAAKEFLKSLDDFESRESKIKAIDKALFKPSMPSRKPLQNELLSELHQRLQVTKNSFIRDLFDVDLHEIEKCYKSEAYKACLALCGSLLEALVLDWLSEVENKNYFESNEMTQLKSLINKLESAECISQSEAQLAHVIREKRNLIHPKNYIANTPLGKKVCVEVMESLRPLVAKRFEIIASTDQ
jgi:hypothetical protein